MDLQENSRENPEVKVTIDETGHNGVLPPGEVITALDGTLLVVKRGQGRPTKDRAYSKTALNPVTEEKRRLLRGLIKAGDLKVAKADGVACELLARALAKVELIDRWLATNGLFDAEGQPWPALRMYNQLLGVSARMCNDLGLTPASKVRLGAVASGGDEGLAELMGDGDGR